MALKSKVCEAIVTEQTFLGCDRELCMTLTFFCVGLAFCSADLLIALISLLTFLVGLYFLRLMAKNDLRLRQVYLRQLKYRPYYKAQGNLLSVPFKKYH